MPRGWVRIIERLAGVVGGHVSELNYLNSINTHFYSISTELHCMHYAKFGNSSKSNIGSLVSQLP